MGFWAIQLSPYSQKLCTIVLPWGKYKYVRLPMLLSVSSNIYQEKMSNLFVDMPEVVYIDDNLVINKGSFKEHLEKIEEVLRRLAQHKLKVHPEKSRFCRYKTEFLGFTLCREGIRPQEQKVEAITALKTPKNVKQVRSSLGLVNYYKQFIPHRSDLLAPPSSCGPKNVIKGFAR
jgi:Reverse transcriptase (RNA-dependent DNA polymerase)